MSKHLLGRIAAIVGVVVLVGVARGRRQDVVGQPNPEHVQRDVARTHEYGGGSVPPSHEGHRERRHEVADLRGPARARPTNTSG